jgi:ferritin-like metal-binding protein YciE
MQTAHELFLHELADMLDAERKLVDALGEMSEEAGNPQLQKGFSAHQAQTEKQVQRLEQIFEQIGEQPEETECKGLKGLLEEYKTFRDEEEPSEDILDVFSIGAASKVESYEINAYESLINLAREMGHNKALKLLQQNLKEEQQTLKKMQGFSKKIKPEQSGMEEEEEESGRGQRSRSSSSSRRSRRAA